MMYRVLIRPLLFLIDPERIHDILFFWFKNLQRLPLCRSLFSSIYKVKHPSLERELFGIKFPNPVGLAAGLDKNAEAIDTLGALGFGFVEIGTLTPVGQPGNPKKRIFRLPEDKALINRMGFNNKGVDEAVKHLKRKRSKVIVGGNIGKNKNTPNEEAVNDYIKGFNTLFEYVDYFAVNVSSPNTPNLRALQDKKPLSNILNSLQAINNTKSQRKPILLKIAPDLTDEQLLDIIDIVNETKIDGVIATNTTLSRDHLSTPQDKVESMGAGGLSGKPLSNRSTEVIKFLAEKSNKSFPIIGVGGIHSAKDALEKLDAGADLVQLYTGFIYEGPGLIKRICKAII